MIHRNYQIDTGTICNLNCIFCYRGHIEDSKKKNTCISLESIKKIFSRKIYFDSLILFSNGEFFANPESMDIFEYCLKEAYFSENKSQDKVVCLNTNATLLSENITDRILEIIAKYKLKIRFTFSINAVNSESYKKISGADLFDRVVSNVKNFMSKSIEFNSKNGSFIHLSPQIVIIDENSEELTDFIDYWQKFYKKYEIKPDICEDKIVFDRLYTVSLRECITGSAEDRVFFENVLENLSEKYKIDFLKVSENKSREAKKNLYKRKVCNQLLELNLYSENKKILCCKDYTGEFAYPYTNGLDEVFRNYYTGLQMTGDFDRISICSECYDYEELDLNELKSNINDKNLIKMYEHRLNTGLPYEFYSVMTESEEDIKNATKFLENNNFYSLSSQKLISENVFYNNKIDFHKKKENFFCAGWKVSLKFKNGKMYAGCEKIDIPIENFKEYSENLAINTEKTIPKVCLNCDRKYSFKKLQDRFRIFGEKSFYSCWTDSITLKKSTREFADLIRERNLLKASEFFKSQNNIDVFLWIVNNYSELVDSDVVFNLVFESDNYLLKLFYTEIANAKFLDCCKNLMNTEFYHNKNIARKIIVTHFENIKNANTLELLYRIHQIFVKNVDYNGYDFQSYRFYLKELLEASILEVKNNDFFLKIYELYNKSEFDFNLFPGFSESFKCGIYKIAECLKIDENNIEHFRDVFEVLADNSDFKNTVCEAFRKPFFDFISKLENKNKMLDYYEFFKNSHFEYVIKEYIKAFLASLDFADFVKFRKVRDFQDVVDMLIKENFLNQSVDINTFVELEKFYNTFSEFIFNEENNQVFENTVFDKFKLLIQNPANLSKSIDFTAKTNNEKYIETVEYRISELLMSRQYFTFFKEIKKILKNSTDKNWLWKRITDFDFNLYDYRFLKLLVVLTTLETEFTDLLNYRIYSFYMKKEKFKNALEYLLKIQNYKNFFDSKNYKKTLKYLKKEAK
ncbi:MAG: radical SAM protein [Candidatus Muiribacteriota bacterium]